MDIPFGYVDSLDIGATLVPMILFAVGQLLAWGMMLLFYILESLSLYTIARRREIRHSWMAWVPVLNLWILGSICDQYQYVVKGRVRSRRKVLLTTKILQLVAGIALVVIIFIFIVEAIGFLPQMRHMELYQIGKHFGGYVAGVIAGYAAIYVLSIVQVVYTYIACHSLYASCDPKNRTVFTVLSIFLPFLIPFFFFACRNKDFGMPPRREAPVQEIPPAYY